MRVWSPIFPRIQLCLVRESMHCAGRLSPACQRGTWVRSQTRFSWVCSGRSGTRPDFLPFPSFSPSLLFWQCCVLIYHLRQGQWAKLFHFPQNLQIYCGAHNGHWALSPRIMQLVCEGVHLLPVERLRRSRSIPLLPYMLSQHA